ncbi:MAG: hypothetical protein ACLFTD_11050, partial [Halochromatium sp.]
MLIPFHAGVAMLISAPPQYAFVVLSSFALVSPHSVHADAVQEQIQQGLDLYQNQDYGAAITELEFAISDIRKMRLGTGQLDLDAAVAAMGLGF